jgi:hypothetical protein
MGQSPSVGRDRVTPGREPRLKERLSGRRIRFTDAERRRLSVEAENLCEILEERSISKSHKDR